MADARAPEWLERANRLALAGTLLATTVHEVNNALQVISGSAEMLTASAPPDVIVRRSDSIGAHARRASALLAELSAFGRDDSSAIVVQDLGQVAQRALAMRQYAVAKLKIETAFESRAADRFVSANPRRLLQIVLNLLTNAERALEDHHERRILVAIGNVGNGASVALTVEDNGPGISEAMVPTLFEAAALAESGHLGIGLAVSRQLAELAGGTLDYAPRPGGGSRFTLTLPNHGKNGR
jgi:signal transduction histidine kinase